MNKKMMITALILLGVLVVLVGITVFLVPQLQRMQLEAMTTTAASTTPPPENLGTRSEQDVVRVQVDRGSESFAFSRSEYLADWKLEGQEELKLNQSLISSLASSASAALVMQELNTDMNDLAQFGLDPAVATVTVKFNDGEEQIYRLGNLIGTQDSCYGLREGVDRLVLMPATFYNYVSYPLYAYAQPKEFSVDPLGAKTLRVEKAGEVLLQAEYVGTGTMSVGEYMITAPYEVQADPEFSTFASKFGNLTLSGMVDVNNDDLAAYGLDAPAYTITVLYEEGLEGGTGNFTMYVGDATEDGEDHYVYFEGEQGVYTVAASNLEFVMTLNPFKLVNRQFMLYSISYVDNITYTRGSDTALLQIIQPPEDADNSARPTYTLDGKDINRVAGVTWYQNVISIYGYGALPADYDDSGEPEVTLAIKYLPGNEVSENLFEFIPYEKDYYAVRVDGTAQFYCRKENVQLVVDNLAKLRAGELDG